MEQPLESIPLPGISIKSLWWLVVTTVVCSAFVVSTYFIKTGELNDKIDKVDDKVEDVLYRDTLRLQIMQMQIDQLRADVIANREILKDIRDTQISFK